MPSLWLPSYKTRLSSEAHKFNSYSYTATTIKVEGAPIYLQHSTFYILVRKTNMLFQYYVLLIIIFSLNKLLEHNLILRDHVIPTVCTWSSLHPEQYVRVMTSAKWIMSSTNMRCIWGGKCLAYYKWSNIACMSELTSQQMVSPGLLAPVSFHCLDPHML